MDVREPQESEKELFNSIVTHPLQSWEWGEFRKKTGIKVIRRIFFTRQKPVHALQLTIHKIPRTNYTLGYLPKGLSPNDEVIDELQKIGKEERCIFIKLEPNVEISNQPLAISNQLVQSSHPLFTKYTFQLDLAKSEEELLKAMHQKTRYNIKVAQKHGVVIEEDNSDKAFETYIKLMHETTKRQRYYAHTGKYHRQMWATLRSQKSEVRSQKDILTAHLLIAKFRPPNSEIRPLILAAWIVFRFRNVLYYPYGASSNEHREVMASNLIMWEAIRFGRKMGCTVFDMWGSLGPNPDPKDPWYGFHRFKEGYGARLVEFIGSYDLVLNPFLYNLYNAAHRARWLYLRAKKLSV